MCWIPKSHVMKDGTCNITPASDPSKDGTRYWNYDNAVLVFDVQRNQWGTIEATSKNPGFLGPNAGDYYNELCKFYNRLRARGYPQQFLQPLFEHAPQHSHRSSFLFKTTGNNKADDIPSVLALPFSEFADKYFKSVLSDRLAELPPHLATVRKISAWKSKTSTRFQVKTT